MHRHLNPMIEQAGAREKEQVMEERHLHVWMLLLLLLKLEVQVATELKYQACWRSSRFLIQF